MRAHLEHLMLCCSPSEDPQLACQILSIGAQSYICSLGLKPTTVTQKFLGLRLIERASDFGQMPTQLTVAPWILRERDSLEGVVL